VTLSSLPRLFNSLGLFSGVPCKNDQCLMCNFCQRERIKELIFLQIKYQYPNSTPRLRKHQRCSCFAQLTKTGTGFYSIFVLIVTSASAEWTADDRGGVGVGGGDEDRLF
jgi:hypothetical protein